MTLRGKTVVLVSTIYCVLLLVVGVFTSRVLLAGFARVERDILRPNADRLTEAISTELGQMDTVTADWALWDDVYDFVANGNQNFIRENLNDPSIENLRLNAILFVQNSGRITYATGFDLKTGQRDDLPEGLLPRLTQESPLMNLTHVDSACSGILMLPRGPLLLSARPICNTERDAPVRGVLITGRFLDEQVLDTIHRVVRRPVSMTRLDDDVIPADVEHARASLESGEAAYIRVIDRHTISTYALMRDIHGAPAIILRVDSPRDIYKSGVRSVINMAGWLTLAGLLFGGATLWLMEKSVLSRLHDLTEGVRGVNPTSGVLPRVAVSGSDELSEFAMSINRMLAALERARDEQLNMQTALAQSEAVLRMIIEHSPSAYYSHTIDHVITYVSPRIRDLLGYEPDDMKERWTEFLSDNPANAEGLELTRRAVETGTPQRPYELELVGVGGRKVWVQVRESPVMQDGKTIAIVGSLTDITERKQSDLALRESEERYRVLFDEMLTGYALHEIILDPRGVPCDYRFLDINPAFEKITGLSRERAIGRTVKEILPQLGSIWIERYGRVALSGVAEHFEDHEETLGKDFEVVAYCPKPGQFAALFTDITERAKAERDLRLFRSLVDNSRDSFEVIDPETGRFLDVNERGCRDLGYSREEFLALSIFDVDPLVDAAHFAEAVAEIRRKDSVTWKSVHRRKDGSIFPVEISLKHVRFDRDYLVSVARDITTQQLAEQAKARLVTAVEQAAETIVITDTTGTILYVNPAFEKVTGYSRTEALGQNPRVLKSGKHSEEFYRDLWAHLADGKVWSGRLTNKRKDGSLYEEDATISPVFDEAGKIVNYVAVKRDVTREVAMEAQIRQAQKLEAVGRLAGGVAHDFNNHLQVIIGHAEIGLAACAEDDPHMPEFHEILNAAQHSAGLTRQLLTFSRQQAIVPVVLNMNDALNGSLSMLRRLIGEHIRLSVTMHETPWRVLIDPVQVNQLLVNLVVNARDAINGPGHIAIEVANTRLQESDCLDKPDFVTPGDYVSLSIRDDGSGMSPEVQAHVFEPFFTTKGVGKGTGLGLATVYGIVKQNGGAITVQSEPKQGTTFTVYLPRSGKETVEAAEPVAPHMQTGTETILVAEDDVAVLQLVKRALGETGYHVIETSSPDAALQRCKDYAGDIHMLLTDVVMPGMGGKQLAEHVRKLRPGIRVLYMSGYPADITEKQGLLPPGMHVLAKPFTVAEFARRIRLVLDEPQRANEGSSPT